ncbi:SusC/RagA family TonB-linked outer membrane protein [Mariniphaga sediminis]|uniref:SusC/RagA family TonB-linked outer membrane protein n=1 Tax=Mariniphaga sediminis TaxID=1628158 RepID=A0A399D7B1_9BACT|nr:TonB-dependent receptor [Mariniphaga sediminis]RIH67018.1 SusC/RagA family TonB-linked outer membrane protein [Mariniphaga sediminis]
MKKKWIRDALLFCIEPKMWKIMRLSAFFLFVCLSHAWALSGYSQETKLTIKMNDSRIIDVLDEIENQSDFYFLFNQKLVDIERKVDIDVEQKTIDNILQTLFSGTNVNYLVYDRQIVLTTFNEKLLPDQAKTVSGKVTDSDGQPLPGVTVVVKGTTQGTVTDANGSYSIVNIPLDARLLFSFVGMKAQEIAVGSQTSIYVVMEEEAIGLKEVVAIGYGTQKKVNLTGSVSSVSSEQLSKRAASQASQLLQGVMSGITATQTSGEPGSDAASLRIRGLGTFSRAGTGPLVLVDGVPSSINSVNPNNVESISVLKDAASAAIYGSRAANGVIIVQTKRGKEGMLQVHYESYVGKQQATELPQYVDSWTYAEMKNEARINMGQNPEFTQEEIEKFRSGVDPDNYPNKHHLKDLFNSGDGLQMKHNITFNGGTEGAQYLFSTGYLKQNGLIEQNEYDRYDMLLNVNSKLNNNLTLNVKFNGSQSIRNRPAGITDDGARTSDLVGVITAANAYNATVPGEKSDGTYGTFMGHPVAEGHLASGSFSETKGTSFSSNISLEWKIVESLKIAGRFSYRYGHSKYRLFGAKFTADPNWSFGPNQAYVNSSLSRELLNDIILNYDKSFGNHSLQILAGFSNESYDGETLTGYRDNFPSNNLHFLDAASPSNDENSEYGNTWKLISYFGRLNYSLLGRYLLEGNIRYDGSSRFSTRERFGLFPSFSAAWIISEEKFFQVPWVENLKIRGSHGILGNQQIGDYPYQKVLNLSSKYATGEEETILPGIQLTNLPFSGITWEETKITNGGVDLGLFGGKLIIVGDYYYKKTENILYNISVSQVLGMSVGEQNAGAVENKGFEFEINHKNRIKDFSYSIFSNFSVNHNKVLDLAEVEQDIGKGLFIGHPLNSIYGYQTEGLFIDETDIANYATQNYTAKPGFPRFKDISGPDGVPDGIITSAHDRTIIGNLFPKYLFGMGITADFKGFDFYLQLQGQAGLEKLIQGKELAFVNNGNIQQWHIDNRWTEKNPDRHAKYPRLEMALHEYPWEVNLDYWTRDASFLRVKTIQLGYNITSKLLQRTFIDQFRVYVNGENIKSFDHYYPGWDPEMTTTGGQNPSYYPITGLWSVGISVQF